MANRLFKRGVKVTVARPVSFTTQEPNATEVTDLRVQFHVVKTLRKEPNTADVVITNLAERTRTEFQKRPLWVRLDAGYDDDLKRLFVGDLRRGQSIREGADWETTLQLGDGDRAYRFGRVSRSYRAGADARTAVVETAKALGLTPRLSATAERELRAQFAGGLVVFGSAQEQMTQLLTPFGLSWSIQDGNRLVILSAEEFLPDQALVINQDTGLIGSPAWMPSERKRGKDSLMFRVLLTPEICPGGRVQVESVGVSGLFKVLRVEHVGDTHGQDWLTTVEAKPV